MENLCYAIWRILHYNLARGIHEPALPSPCKSFLQTTCEWFASLCRTWKNMYFRCFINVLKDSRLKHSKNVIEQFIFELAYFITSKRCL